jgi:hypothetical protein
MSTTFVNDHLQKLDTSVDSKFRSTDCDVAQVESSSTYNAEHDQRDMRRLGKHQELKVRSCKCSRGIPPTDPLQAPLPIPQHRRLHHRPRPHLGILHRDLSLLSSERRHRWRHMACPHSHFRHVHGHVIHGGDG